MLGNDFGKRHHWPRNGIFQRFPLFPGIFLASLCFLEVILTQYWMDNLALPRANFAMVRTLSLDISQVLARPNAQQFLQSNSWLEPELLPNPGDSQQLIDGQDQSHLHFIVTQEFPGSASLTKLKHVGSSGQSNSTASGALAWHTADLSPIPAPHWVL